MPRHIAFLRAINVGGHTVKMDALRRLFEELGFEGVETFIASGNVVFETAETDAAALERRIEAHLRDALGYDVATFLRRDAEVAAVAAYQPFPPAEMAAAMALYVGFLGDALDEASVAKVHAFATDIDVFHVHQREIYWACRRRQSESTFSNAVLERALRRRATWRGINTLQRLAAKYPPRGG
ncbi:MAG: DUF1697 domain-containing protein [Anaerolineae bacterium]|jgi:uncharacterized protein (DUF1697 family)|nr:DUF1697 domain-containing protein [Anaerolineae bacterium]